MNQQLEPENTIARKGDILIAVRTFGCGNLFPSDFWYEQVAAEGKEYACLCAYWCNGPCVYISDDSGNSMMGTSQDNFRIKKRI